MKLGEVKVEGYTRNDYGVKTTGQGVTKEVHATVQDGVSLNTELTMSPAGPSSQEMMQMVKSEPNTAMVESTPQQLAPQKTETELAPKAPTGVTQFDDLSETKQQKYVDTLKTLDKNARLFVEYEGQLKRAEPCEIRECLDNGQGVYLVSRLAETSYDSSYSSSESGHSYAPKILGIIGAESIDYHSWGGANSKSVFVKGGISKLSKWSSLELVNTDKQGVPGAPLLSKDILQGASVMVSSDFESMWSSRYHSESGVIWSKEFNKSNASHESKHYRAF